MPFDPLARVRKNTQAILEKNRKPSADELMGDAGRDIPETAPQDYGEAGAAPVLGNVYDDRLVEASGTMASPYWVDEATSKDIQAGKGAVQFSGRYGERMSGAGPEDLTVATPIMKVNRADARYRAAENALAREAEPAEEAAPAGFDTSTQSTWGDKYDSSYNYTWVPGKDGGAPRIKVMTNRNGRPETFFISEASDKEAFDAIVAQREEMADKPQAVREFREPAAEDEVEAPAAEVEAPPRDEGSLADALAPIERDDEDEETPEPELEAPPVFVAPEPEPEPETAPPPAEEPPRDLRRLGRDLGMGPSLAEGLEAFLMDREGAEEEDTGPSLVERASRRDGGLPPR
jgi:hypothetical protein